MPSVQKQVPRSGQRKQREPDQDQDQDQQPDGRKKGVQRGATKSRFVLKVKLPRFNSRTLVERVCGGNKTPARWILEPSASNTPRTGDPGDPEDPEDPEAGTRCDVLVDIRQQAASDCEPADGSGSCSSQRSTIRPAGHKEKAKLSVLSTISRMLEENKLIRVRLADLSQTC